MSGKPVLMMESQRSWLAPEPSGDTARLLTRSVWPVNSASRRAFSTSHTMQLYLVRGKHQAPADTEPHRGDSALEHVVAQLLQAAVGPQIIQTARRVIGSCADRMTVREEPNKEQHMWCQRPRDR